jgi:hypothetical protein
MTLTVYNSFINVVIHISQDNYLSWLSEMKSEYYNCAVKCGTLVALAPAA